VGLHGLHPWLTDGNLFRFLGGLSAVEIIAMYPEKLTRSKLYNCRDCEVVTGANATS